MLKLTGWQRLLSCEIYAFFVKKGKVFKMRGGSFPIYTACLFFFNLPCILHFIIRFRGFERFACHADTHAHR